ncbi:MAG: glutamate--cysteine ligase [Gammaproteobacteria bacterium]|nr:MAG: glutamate--cysteine ligase [Gammaproteobacteria bacterium]UTW42996.1 glutamate--cysteine ligase [bacterium SCSIO 12844]
MNLSDLDFKTLDSIKRGIEREALRVTPKGNVAQSNHSKKLGEKLTHPNITVDYSEGLLELITEPFESYSSLFESLETYLNFTYQNLEHSELLWPMSMPPKTCEDEIKIADFGHSNSGMMKHIYRRGLAIRYGKVMQIIAGIHYNFSFPDEFLSQLIPENGHSEHTLQYYKNKYYFRLIRKFYQNAWLLPYLFGATPIIAKTSVNNQHKLQEFDSQYYYHKYATCLRMSEFGYQSHAQKDLNISYRDIKSYVNDLVKATQIPFSDYTQLGVLDKNYGYKQLNDCILQIENEYYNPIRPKQIVHRCERPACALSKRGVSYIELRTLDINPFMPLGIDLQSAHFLDVFFLYCLLAEAPIYSKSMIQIAKENFALVANYGRNPQLKLHKNSNDILLKDWAHLILNECLLIAEKWDQTNATNHYQSAVYAQIEKLNDVEKTPSAMLINSIKQSKLNTEDWMLNQAYQHQQSLLETKLPLNLLAKLKREVSDSQEALKLLETKEEGAFESYIQRYYASVCR